MSRALPTRPYQVGGRDDDDPLKAATDLSLAMQRIGRYVSDMIRSGTITADELLQLELPGRRAELVKGVLVVREPAGYRHGEVAAKLGDWLVAGSRLVWVVDPKRRLARVYRADGSETILGDDGVLVGEDVVPGFACPLESVL